MKVFSRLRDTRYCAFCKSPRKLYVKKHIDLTNVLGVLLLTALLTYGLYGSADPRGLLIFSVFMLFGEVFTYMRWRASLACRMCGFDPVIYKKSPEQASERVRQFFKEAAEKPEFWLSRSPLLQLHRRLRDQERKRQELAYIRSKKANDARGTRLPTASAP